MHTGPALGGGQGPWLIDHRSGRCPSPRPPGPRIPSVRPNHSPLTSLSHQVSRNYKCFGQYDKDVTAVLSGAREYVESYVQLVAGKETNLAIVLDIDETALFNWPVIRCDDFAFIKKGDCGDLSKEEFCGWVAWQARAEDKPIEPTLELFNASKAKGVTVFFITGRCAIGTTRATTEANLKAAELCGLGGQGIDHAPRRMSPSRYRRRIQSGGARQDREGGLHHHRQCRRPVEST
jgi:hypothetical protein